MGRIFLIPAIVALVTLAGLIAGLLGDGARDVVAWLGLGLPIVIIGWALCGGFRSAAAP